MEDATDAVLPEAVPRNPDGSARTDGEVSKEQAQQIGALDLESAAENARWAQVITSKARGETDVPWNAHDVFQLYAGVRATFGEWATLTVTIARLEPAPCVVFPPVRLVTLGDAAALYALIEKYHGASPVVAKYKVRFSAQNGAVKAQTDVSLDPMFVPPAPPVDPRGYDPQGYPPQGYPPPRGYLPSQGYPPPPQGHVSPGQDPRVIVNMPQQAAPAEYRPAYDPQHDRIADLVAAQQQGMKEMLGAFMQVVEKISRPLPPPPPPMPAGFIPLPEGYPIPVGWIAFPGGCMPAPPQAAAPQVVYAPPSAQAVAPVAPQAAVAAPYVPPSPITPAQAVADSLKMFKSLNEGMESLKSMIQGATPSPAEVAEEIADAVAEPAVKTTQIGDLTMVHNKDASTNWGLTLMGAAPKIVEALRSGISEYNKVVDKQAALHQQAVKARIELAKAVAQVPGHVPAPSPVMTAGPVQPVVPPVQQAAPSVVSTRPRPVPPRRTGIPDQIPNLWGTSPAVARIEDPAREASPAREAPT
jgi:hypothetical protein